MAASLRRLLVRPVILPVLCLFLLFGHACDLPGYVNLVARADAAEDPHHAVDQHGDEDQVRCDAVEAVPTPAYSHTGLGLELAMAVLDDGPAFVRPAIRFVECLTRLPSRPPLFLLYESLLI